MSIASIHFSHRQTATWVHICSTCAGPLHLKPGTSRNHGKTMGKLHGKTRVRNSGTKLRNACDLGNYNVESRGGSTYQTIVRRSWWKWQDKYLVQFLRCWPETRGAGTYKAPVGTLKLAMISRLFFATKSMQLAFKRKSEWGSFSVYVCWNIYTNTVWEPSSICNKQRCIDNSSVYHVQSRALDLCNYQ